MSLNSMTLSTTHNIKAMIILFIIFNKILTINPDQNYARLLLLFSNFIKINTCNMCDKIQVKYID